MYAVYLTIYRGKKLPPFYIGSTSLKKIKDGYRGSVVSKKYGDIFKLELLTNPQLFDVIILSRHSSRKNALEAELILQKELDVVKSNQFFNEAYASVNGMFGRDVSGDSNPMFGKKQTEQTKEKIREKRGHNKRYEATEEHKKITSKTHKGKIVSQETRTKLSSALKGKYVGEDASFFGRKHSEETKCKISQKNKGKIVSDEAKDKIYKANKGKIVTEECRRKISEAKKGKKRETFSKEWCENISKANKGRVVSDETRKKLSNKRNSKKYICPHCGQNGGGGNMKRYHFDNCKLK